MQVSFIGLGAMGYPMAAHVAKAHQTLVWNRTPAKARRHASEHESQVAESLEECARADAIVTMLPTSVEVDAVADAMLPRLRDGALWIDTTSGDPAMCRRTAARLAARGVGFVDAPVTGGVPGAKGGTLTVMAGGPAADFERARPVLASFGSTLIHVGDTGAGHAIKVQCNALLAVNLWMTGECLLILRKQGVDVRTALEVINAGSGRSYASAELLPRRLVDGEWPVTFRLGLHDKDVRIAAAQAHAEHAYAPMLFMTSQLLTAAVNDLGPDADYIEVVRHAARMNATSW